MDLASRSWRSLDATHESHGLLWRELILGAQAAFESVLPALGYCLDAGVIKHPNETGLGLFGWKAVAHPNWH